MVIFQRNWVTIYSWVLSGSQCAKVIKVRDLHQHIASSTPAAMLQIHVPLSSSSINLYPSKSGVAPQPCGTDISGASTYRVMAMDRTTSTHTNAPCGVWSSLSSHWFCRKLRLVSTACLVLNISLSRNKMNTPIGVKFLVGRCLPDEISKNNKLLSSSCIYSLTSTSKH